MRQSLSLEPVLPWRELLGGGESGGVGAHPVALRLVDLPLIRAVQKLESPEHAQGRLPLHAYTAQLQGRRPDGSLYEVVVKGDDKHGLPYGSDGDIFFALFKIADELPDVERAELMVTGQFRDPTVGMIARAMGRPMNGETSRRIRDALHRLSHVRIEMHLTHGAQELGGLLLGDPHSAGEKPQDGALRPMEPDGAPVPRIRKGSDTIAVLHVLEYSVTRSYDRRAEGEDWISHLQINPVWLRELAAGWVAWVNVERYVALRSPIAKRLYQLFAGEAARGVRTPWVYGLQELQQRCGMVGIARRPASVRDSIQDAAGELIEWDILSAIECAKVRHGRYAFSFEPGAHLRFAALLRGVGALDARELRVQRMLLRYFGIRREQADRLLAERPSRVHEALQYLLYVRDTDRARVKRSWSAYLLKLVDGEANLAGDVRYQAWLTAHQRPPGTAHVGSPESKGGSVQRLQPGVSQENDIAPDAAQAVGSVDRIPAIDAARTIPVSSEATQLWSRVRGQAAARYPHTHRAYVEDLAAYDLVGDTLICVSTSEFTLRKLESIGLAAIEEELASATAGRVSRLQLDVFRRERHQRQGGAGAELA